MKPRQSGRTIQATALCALLAATPMAAHALDVDPGDYQAAPPGTNLILGYGQFGWDTKYITSSGHSVSDSNLSSQVGILRGVHYFDALGITIDPQFLLPFGNLGDAKVGGTPLKGSSGFGDLILASTEWIINQPDQKRWLGFTPFFFLPTGAYQPGQAVNIGENRFKTTLQFGYVQGFDKWFVDLIGDTTFYAANNQAGFDGRQKLTQSNTFTFQAWLRYYIIPTWSVGAGYAGAWNGIAEIDGTKSGGTTQVQQLRLITQYFVTPSLQLQATALTDVASAGGFRQTFGIDFRVMKVF